MWKEKKKGCVPNFSSRSRASSQSSQGFLAVNVIRIGISPSILGDDITRHFQSAIDHHEIPLHSAGVAP
jgi:hypothetical protein